jgi:hypothetical protein
MYDVNGYRICWFFSFRFPRENSLCNAHVFSIIYIFSFIENLFVVNNCTRLKSTFGIREIIGFGGMPLWSRVWLETVIILVTVGDLWY